MEKSDGLTLFFSLVVKTEKKKDSNKKGGHTSLWCVHFAVMISTLVVLDGGMVKSWVCLK